jgi:hypothetical protein
MTATDPEWAEAVAEARGLVAASSRVLSALDHVPADVIPKRESARAPRRLPWWAKAAAAVVIMTGGTVLVMQRAFMPALSEVGETKAVASAVDVSTERAAMPSKTPAPARGGLSNAQPSARTALDKSKPEQDNSSVQRTLSGPPATARAAAPAPALPTPSINSMARDAVAAMQGVGTPTPAVISPPASAIMESRVAAERAMVAKTVTDARRQDTATGRPAERLALRALEPVEPTARRVGRVKAGAAPSSSTICYQVRDAKSPTDAGVIMRAVRVDGDTLRLEPAQGTSALRAWIVWRDSTGLGAISPSADGRGAVAVVATRSPCPAP